MKNVWALLLVSAIIAAAIRLNPPETGTVKIDNHSIKLTSADGKHSILLHAGQSQVGIWVSGEGRHCSIVSGEGSSYFGVQRDSGGACEWAVVISDGGAFIQKTGDKGKGGIVTDEIVTLPPGVVPAGQFD